MEVRNGKVVRLRLRDPARWEELRIMLLRRQGEVVTLTSLQEAMEFHDRNISKPGRLLEQLELSGWIKIDNSLPSHRTWLIAAPKTKVTKLPVEVQKFQAARRAAENEGRKKTFARKRLEKQDGKKSRPAELG